MLAGSHAGFEMQRPEVRRRGQQNNIHTAVDQLLISVKPHETPLRRNLHFVTDLLVSLDLFQACRQAIFKSIGHRNQLHILVSSQCLRRGTSSTPAASHQANAQHISAGNMKAQRRARGQHAAYGGSRRLQKPPPRWLG